MKNVVKLDVVYYILSFVVQIPFAESVPSYVPAPQLAPFPIFSFMRCQT